MEALPAVVVRAAEEFGLDPRSLQCLGGASAWSDGPVVLRVGKRVSDEILAASAAAPCRSNRPRTPRRRAGAGDPNVLVDDEGEVTGVIDWTNAAAGDRSLDAARTWSILTLDPTAIALQATPGWTTLTESWLQAGHSRHGGRCPGVGPQLHARGPRRATSSRRTCTRSRRRSGKREREMSVCSDSERRADAADRSTPSGLSAGGSTAERGEYLLADEPDLRCQVG